MAAERGHGDGMTTLHNLGVTLQAVAITSAATLAIAYPAWLIRYNRRTRARYGRTHRND